ncbi:Oxidoreductase/transition metal ion-binding protein [Quillaja saponaria]|uniref:Oxidoreductase/transition metal ion-binding protein n=1 Tax=Quillaja saponaria TaxID=32244 RepID=A0AAD7LZT0_QUISA|nr:Oxidoreductase/transition metal ion-binding protein [Quillaja saponaria]
MAYDRRNRASSVLEGFSLNPLPYPVLFILAVISIFLGISWYFSYEEALESAEEQMGWALLATPVVLILIVRWLSSMESTDWLFGISPWERRRRTHNLPSEGSSPWGVAALIVLLLILVQYQSNFLDSWFG